MSGPALAPPYHKALSKNVKKWIIKHKKIWRDPTKEVSLESLYTMQFQLPVINGGDKTVSIIKKLEVTMGKR